jgi:hypothetical protein
MMFDIKKSHRITKWFYVYSVKKLLSLLASGNVFSKAIVIDGAAGVGARINNSKL